MKKTIAVIQLTRIGDILQTLMSIKSFKSQNPEYRFVGVFRKTYGSPLKNLISEIFEKSYFIDTASLFESVEYSKEFSPVVQKAKSLINEINQEKIDLLINLSFSKSSSYLSTLIQSPHKLGINQSSEINVRIPDIWSRYLYSTVMATGKNPFSLVDIFRNILDHKTEYEPQFPDLKRDKKIIIHPFASHPKKRWSAQFWSQIIKTLCKQHPHYKFYIVGSNSELEQAQEIFHHPLLSSIKNQMINMVGQTNIDELKELLFQSRLFIGHDSMVGHLAAWTRTQCLTISIGTVRPHETTPYLAGNYVLAPKINCFPCHIPTRCADFECHQYISPSIVSECTKEILENNCIDFSTLKSKLLTEEIHRCQIYETQWDDSGLCLIPAFIDDRDLGNIFSDFYRFLWSAILNEQELKKPFPLITEGISHILGKYIEGLEHFYELNGFGLRFSNELLDELKKTNPSLEVIQDLSRKIGEIDKMTLDLKRPYPYLSPLADYYHVRKSSLAGDALKSITEECLLTFHQFNLSVSILYDMIKGTIGNYKKETSAKIERQQGKA